MAGTGMSKVFVKSGFGVMAVGEADRHYPKFFSSLAEGEESHLSRICQRKLEITAL